MYETNITNDYGNMTGDYIDTFSKNNNCTKNENNIESIIPFYTLFPRRMSLICLISLMEYTLIKPLFNDEEKEKIFYPNHPVRCIITGPSECGKSVFLTNLILNIINEYDNMIKYTSIDIVFIKIYIKN